MITSIDAGENCCDFAFGVNDVGVTFGIETHESQSVVFFGDILFVVGNELKGEIILVFKFILRGQRIKAYSIENDA